MEKRISSQDKISFAKDSVHRKIWVPLWNNTGSYYSKFLRSPVSSPINLRRNSYVIFKNTRDLLRCERSESTFETIMSWWRTGKRQQNKSVWLFAVRYLLLAYPRSVLALSRWSTPLLPEDWFLLIDGQEVSLSNIDICSSSFGRAVVGVGHHPEYCTSTTSTYRSSR